MNNKYTVIYPKPIRDAVQALCDELIKHYPDAFKQLYDSCGLPNESGSNFQQRMEQGVYIELIKAGEKISITSEEIVISSSDEK